MRRALSLVPLLLILALAACGGAGANTNSGGAGEPKVLAAFAGSASSTREPQAAQGAPEPSPFALAQGLVLEEVHATPNSDGGYTFTGTIVNRGQEPLAATRISLDLLDETGKVAAKMSFSNAKLAVLKPGETTTWKGTTTFQTKAWQEIRPTVEGTAPGQ